MLADRFAVRFAAVTFDPTSCSRSTARSTRDWNGVRLAGRPSGQASITVVRAHNRNTYFRNTITSSRHFEPIVLGMGFWIATTKRLRRIDLSLVALLSAPCLFFAGAYHDTPHGMRKVFLDIAAQRLAYLEPAAATTKPCPPADGPERSQSSSSPRTK